MHIITGDENFVGQEKKSVRGFWSGKYPSLPPIYPPRASMGNGTNEQRQLNDIWPGTSWALVDVNWSRKASFYITKRALSTFVVGMERVVTGTIPYMVTMYPSPKSSLSIWAINGLVTPLSAVLKLSAFDIERGERVELEKGVGERRVELKPNQTTEIGGLKIPSADSTVVVAYLDDAETGERLARWVDWPEPLKFVHFSKTPNVSAKLVASGEGDVVILSATTPVKGVMLGVPISEGGEDAVWDDNFIDLVPGEEITVKVSGLKGRKIETGSVKGVEN
jgi:beta-mannosidase